MSDERTPGTLPILFTREDGIACIQLDRPEKRNALDLTMRRAIADAFDAVEHDPDVRAVVLTGGDKVFAAGADLNMLVDKDASAVAKLGLPDYWAPLQGCTKPIIAHVAGAALGAGCELAMMCDIIIAEPAAIFGQPELNVGIMPGAGGTQRLIRAIGKQAASLMLFTGIPIDAARAHTLGLVAEIVEEGAGLTRSLALARRAARMPPLAVAATKRVLTDGPNHALPAALLSEHTEFLKLFDSADKTEGMRAFLDKRKPVFRGR